jgi:helix-turn-helix protein
MERKSHRYIMIKEQVFKDIPSGDPDAVFKNIETSPAQWRLKLIKNLNKIHKTIFTIKEIIMDILVYTEKQVSALIGISLSKLRKDRCYMRGLKYIKIGRSIRYHRDDIERYIQEHRINPQKYAA